MLEHILYIINLKHQINSSKYYYVSCCRYVINIIRHKLFGSFGKQQQRP